MLKESVKRFLQLENRHRLSGSNSSPFLWMQTLAVSASISKVKQPNTPTDRSGPVLFSGRVRNLPLVSDYSSRPLDGKSVSKSPKGPWAWLRTLDKAIVKKTGQSERFIVTFQVDSYKAEYELRAMSVDNPFQLTELQSFRCPGSL